MIRETLTNWMLGIAAVVLILSIFATLDEQQEQADGETILQRVMGNTTEIRRVNKELAMMKNERDMLLLALKNSSGALEAFANISITVRQQLKENNDVLAKTTEGKS